MRARYYGNVTLIDRSVGKIRNALEETGHANSTIIVFTSDHGEMVGDHGILGKTVLYEESVKVPLLIHVPWLSTEQTKIPGNISHIDLVPTLLDLMNESIPDHLQGQSRVPTLTGAETLVENDDFIQWIQTPGTIWFVRVSPAPHDPDFTIQNRQSVVASRAGHLASDTPGAVARIVAENFGEHALFSRIIPPSR